MHQPLAHEAEGVLLQRAREQVRGPDQDEHACGGAHASGGPLAAFNWGPWCAPVSGIVQGGFGKHKRVAGRAGRGKG